MKWSSSKANSTKLWITTYSILLLPVLLWHGKLTADLFVSAYTLCVGAYFGANVWATREQANSATAVIKAQSDAKEKDK